MVGVDDLDLGADAPGRIAVDHESAGLPDPELQVDREPLEFVEVDGEAHLALEVHLQVQQRCEAVRFLVCEGHGDVEVSGAGGAIDGRAEGVGRDHLRAFGEGGREPGEYVAGEYVGRRLHAPRVDRQVEGRQRGRCRR